jgi:hypothetical protein
MFVFDSRNCNTPIDKRESHAKLEANVALNRWEEEGNEGGDNDGTLNGYSKESIGGQVAKTSGMNVTEKEDRER